MPPEPADSVARSRDCGVLPGAQGSLPPAIPAPRRGVSALSGALSTARYRAHRSGLTRGRGILLCGARTGVAGPDGPRAVEWRLCARPLRTESTLAAGTDLLRIQLTRRGNPARPRGACSRTRRRVRSPARSPDPAPAGVARANP